MTVIESGVLRSATGNLTIDAKVKKPFAVHNGTLIPT